MSVSSSVRRWTAVAGVAAVAVGATTLPAAAADHDHGRSRHSAVFISGVHHDSRGRENRSNRSLNKEWVDITNSTRRAVNLNGWTLSDEDGHTYTFHHVRLHGRSTVRVHTGTGRNTRFNLYQDRHTHVWDKGSDSATLRNNHGRFVDKVSWGHHHRGDDRRHHGGDRHGGNHQGGHGH
ncbi:hypothetical protein LK08_06950 [Streptomyces sp. MUSC 125]|uniref:lamin tail domain-containing protein n=1 Tax=Streptomyces TaxID=1883 RepID=UPI000575C777|nr:MULTISPECIES: lamin tail domain-containing protein [Streptomyces]KIE27703.1 hypothetical protein LK08_06950 [Streptomyces sp. MUSC 125]